MHITMNAGNGGHWKWRAVTITNIYNRVSLCSCLRACWQKSTEQLEVFCTS